MFLHWQAQIEQNYSIIFLTAGKHTSLQYSCVNNFSKKKFLVLTSDRERERERERDMEFLLVCMIVEGS